MLHQPLRIGHGYDVHKLVTGRSLILAGVDIPYEFGLLGHSDADVATHAIMDSLLGALSLGDIGKLFPDTDKTYKNIHSISLLQKCCELIQSNGYILGNLDVTIIAQNPKLSPYMLRMRENIAVALKANLHQISIKATTEEGLGFTGENLGIAAHCVCILFKIQD